MISTEKDECDMTDEEKRVYLIKLYNKTKHVELPKEYLDDIGKQVRTNIVRNIKFVPDEHTSGLTKNAIEDSRKFPSFWQPDLTVRNSLQNDCFSVFENMSNAPLKEKVQAWIGMRMEVVKSIRMHRNNTRNALQKSIVEGKQYVFFIINCYITYI